MPIADLTAAEQLERQHRASRGILWFGIVSIIMLFAGLTSAYVVRQGEGKWVQFSLPQLFIISTIVIVASSITMQLAIREIRLDHKSKLKTFLLLTAVLGISFVFIQYLAWSDLVSQGIYFVGKVKDIHATYNYIPTGRPETPAEVGETGNVAASFLYVITGLHLAHLFGGILALAVVLSKSFFGKYSAANYNGVKMCSIYWHFLTGLWVYLFFFLNYIR